MPLLAIPGMATKAWGLSWIQASGISRATASFLVIKVDGWMSVMCGAPHWLAGRSTQRKSYARVPFLTPVFSSE